jgi:DNA-binding beta-propeller fold protein YncE
MRSPRVLLLALVASAALGGCATTQKTPPADVVWPPPPEVPRIKFLRAFATDDDLGGGLMRSLGRAFLPSDSAIAIAQPTGLALSPDEQTLYVSCNAPQRVLAVDLANNSMRVFLSKGENSPKNPFGVATDAAGNVYVTDHSAGPVFVYAPDGKFLRKFGKDQLERPTGIAIDRRRQLVYVTAGAASTSKHHRVEVFSLKGDHLRTIGTRGHEAGQFNFPANLATAPDGQLFVVDMLNFRIQVFDPDGQLVGMFGTLGAGQPGTFDKAKGIALDGFGNVYVTDSAQGFVQLFNPRYQPLMAFGGHGLEAGYMHVPTAIAITTKNRIFVADFAVDRVGEYELINTSAEDLYRPSAPAKPTDVATPAAGATGAKAPAPASTPAK